MLKIETQIINRHFFSRPNTFEERHARLSESQEPVVRHAPLSEPQYEPTYNIYPPLQQDPNRVRHLSQNQNTLEINRQLYIEDEIEISKPPEYNSIYLNHQ